MWRFDTVPNPAYSGDQVGLAMTGISSTFAELNGCWYALPMATQVKHAAVSRQEVDVAGNRTGSG
jgi:hypothetical protein